MKIEIDGQEIRIIGKNAGKYRYLSIWINEDDAGKDRYQLSINEPCEGGVLNTGGLPTIIMDCDNVIRQDYNRQTII